MLDPASETIQPRTPPSPAHGRSPVRRGLVALNLGLLVAIGLVGINGWAGASAGAQPEAERRAARIRGDYALVAGRFQGATASAVYILDAANQELLALSWDRNTRRFQPIGFRSLTEDARIFKEGR